MRDAAEPIEKLMRRFEIPLLQFATRIMGDRERARDIVQETFLKYQRNGARLRDATPRHARSTSSSEEPATWLFTVCRNAALNVCRKEKRMLFLDEEIIESYEDEQAMPFTRIEQEEASRFLGRILATLPPRQQEVLQLKFQNDFSYQEIAEITNTNANNVGVLIHTALKTLRQRFAHASKDFLPFEPRTA